MRALEGLSSHLQLAGCLAKLCKLAIPQEKWTIPL